MAGHRGAIVFSFPILLILTVSPATTGWGQETAPPPLPEVSASQEEGPPAPEAPFMDTAPPEDNKKITSPKSVPSATEEILAPLESAEIPEGDVLDVPDPDGKSAPRRHIVRKGDTLWDITHSYLKDSFLWPKVWKTNRFIINADLIYPGNVILLPSEEELAAALGEPVPPMAPRKTELEPEPDTGETAPKAAESQETPGSQERVLQAGISELVVPRAKPSDLSIVASSGYILTDVKPAGIVVGARDDRELIGQDETMYFLPQGKNRPRVGERYTLYRLLRKVYHPETGKYLGDLIRILGMSEVTGSVPGEETITTRILVSYDHILKGDPAMLYRPMDPPTAATNLPFFKPDKNLDGYVVDVKETRTSYAQDDIIYIDRGRRDGLRPGDTFSIVRSGDRTSFFSPGGGVQLPSRTIGQFQIISIQDGTATAKIIKSTEVVRKGDRFKAFLYVNR